MEKLKLMQCINTDCRYLFRIIIFLSQRAIADAPRGAVSLQGGAPAPRVPGAVQGAVLTRQCARLHARLKRGDSPPGFWQIALERSHFCPI